jgi:hypothetical protein
MTPVYLVSNPYSPGSPAEASSYFEAGLSVFVVSNRILPLFHVFFLLFLECCTGF